MENLEPDEPDAANAMFCPRIMMAADYAMIMKAIYRRPNVDVWAAGEKKGGLDDLTATPHQYARVRTFTACSLPSYP
jgi:hypothetical protein